MSQTATNYQLAIIGGGIAGLYAAWRLTVDTSSIDSADMVLYEASGRWGGRLYTWKLSDFDAGLPADSSVRAELGGMRISSTHTYVGSLSNHLGLPMAPFAADAPTNYHYLRNGLMTGATLDSQTTSGPLYRLASNEAGEAPSTILENALTGGSNPIVPPYELPSETTSLRNFVEYCLTVNIPTSDGAPPIPAYNLGFWNATVGSGAVSQSQQTISNEAYSFYHEAYSYDTIPANWNAAVALSVVLSDFSNPPPTYYAIAAGYQALPDALQQSLAPSMLANNTSISAVSYDGNVFTLYDVNGQVLSTANKLILALPPRALQIIFENSQSVLEGVDAQNFLDQLGQSSPVPLFKIFLVYAGQDWWTNAVTPAGGTSPAWPTFTRMTTDMPMRQIYNFGFAPPTTVSACQLFQASYSDALNAGYWAGLMPSTEQPSVDTDLFARVVPQSGGGTIADGFQSFNMSGSYTDHSVFRVVHDQFVNLVTQIGAQQVPPVEISPSPPVAGAAMNWATDPFGGGVNFWNVGVNVDVAYQVMLQPNTALPMYIVGEGYSLMQGWVEGALWSVEDMFKQSGMCPPPTWLTTATTFTPTTLVDDPPAYGLPQA